MVAVGERDAGDRPNLLANIESLTLAITVRSIPRMLQPLLETDLTIHQLKALTAVLTSDGGLTLGELAATFSVSMASISKLVDRLVLQGLVERSTDAADQRVRRVVPTALGRAAVRQLIGERPELGAEVLNGLSDEELRALEVGLTAIRRELNNASR